MVGQKYFKAGGGGGKRAFRGGQKYTKYNKINKTAGGKIAAKGGAFTPWVPPSLVAGLSASVFFLVEMVCSLKKGLRWGELSVFSISFTVTKSGSSGFSVYGSPNAGPPSPGLGYDVCPFRGPVYWLNLNF